MDGRPASAGDPAACPEHSRREAGRPSPAWIAVVDEADARGDLAAAYAQCADLATGRVAHVWKAHSLNPAAMVAHRTLYRTLVFGPSPLERTQREMIGVTVSALNGCHY